MNSKRFLLLIYFLLLFLFGYATRIAVKNIDELNNANRQAWPSDTIVLKNGQWKDVIIKLSCTGNANELIVFMAETPGKVHITGRSQLKIGGSFIVVQGLYFTNGYSGKDQSVIDFRIDKDHLANHCADLNKEEADFMYASQGAFYAKGFVTPINNAAWRTKPTFGIVATDDKSILPEIQYNMYKRSNTKVTEIKGIMKNSIYIVKVNGVFTGNLVMQ